MSLVKLTDYQTISTKQQLDVYNSMLEAVDANFTYALEQLANPIPALATGAAGDALCIINTAGVYSLAYRNPNTLISLQSLLTTYNNLGGALAVRNPLEVNVTSLTSSYSNLAIVARATTGSGAINNYVNYTQISGSGELNETHNISAFALTGTSVSLTASTGWVTVNSLQVGDYKLPTTAGSVGQGLKLGAASTLEFTTLPEPVVVTNGVYTLATAKPLALASYNTTGLPLQLTIGSSVGFGFEAGDEGLFGGLAASGLSSFYLGGGGFAGKFLEINWPTTLVNGIPYAPAIRPQLAFVLPAATALTTGVNNYAGSLWYDAADDALVLISATGRLTIKGQAVASAINTEETKAFTLQTNSTLNLGEGTTALPAIKVGSAGLASNAGDMRIVVGGTAVVSVTSTALESPAGSDATAKLMLDGTVGLNNPAKPAYTFSDANGLGIYRSNTNAVALAVKGVAVLELKEAEVDVKGNRVANLATPTQAKDAATKEYVDSMMPVGATPGALAMVSSGQTARYIQSDAKYTNGTLELGGSQTTAAVKLKTANGGSVTVKAGAGNQHITFTLPTNNLANGVLQIDSIGRTAWVDKASLTSNILKPDGSVALTGSLLSTINTTYLNPLIGTGSVGMYATAGTAAKVGFAANGAKLVELDATTKTLTGIEAKFNAPLIRLNSSLASYVGSGEVAGAGLPTYAFAGEPGTGIGQTQIQGISLFVGGTAKLTANETGLQAHNNRLQNLAMPVKSTDAASKQYVDSAVKAPVEISFLVSTLPVGWSSGAALILSLYDKALIYQSASAALTYESEADPAKVIVVGNFNTNPKCQVYVENYRLVKKAKASGVRQVAYLTDRSLLINFDVAIGEVITVQLA